jgi:peptidoglycan/xylan/chitin deacetylase (PgdA/CDA1 family)
MVRLALKIDVDTYHGLKDGVPRLASFLAQEKLPASFFVTMGPDRSGWAAKRFFTRRGFARKMRRTSAARIYGWRTIFSGTLLPDRPMAASFADLMRSLREQGFEVSPHGYDHIRWHDEASGWDKQRAKRELEKVFSIYRRIFCSDPQSFSAPGWQAGEGTWRALEDFRLLYHSDSRGSAPFYPVFPSGVLKTPEIPTTLPTWDEILAWDGMSENDLVDQTWRLLSRDRLNVWTIHAEFEGQEYFARFRQFVMRAKEYNVEWISLPKFAADITAGKIPTAGISQEELPGRAGTVTLQQDKN